MRLGEKEKGLIAQKTPQTLLGPMEGAAHGGTAHAPFLGNFRLTFAGEIHRFQNQPLHIRELGGHHPTDPPKLDLGRQTEVRIVTGYIFHCGSSSFRSSA